MVATGDLRGQFTLDVQADGSGAWSLVVAYVQDYAADGTLAEAPPPHEDGVEPHTHEALGAYEAFVRRGALRGTVTGASVRFNAQGELAAIDGAQLFIADGSLEFEGATGGGWVDLTALQDSGAATGTLNLGY